MTARRALAIFLLAIVAMIWPRSARASIATTTETRVGALRLREPVRAGHFTSPRADIHRAISLCVLAHASDPSLRWKGRPRDVIGGVEVYDMRARWWVPELGAFLSVDELAYHDARTTLWGWPGQNPLRYADPSGHWGDSDSRADTWGNYAATHTDDGGFMPALQAMGFTFYGTLALGPALVPEEGIGLWGALSRSPVGRVVLRLLGAPAAAASQGQSCSAKDAPTPRGFADAQQYDQAKAELEQALRASGP